MNPFKEDLRQVVFLACVIFSSMALPSSSSSSSEEGDSRIPVPTNVEIKMVNETTALLTWDSDNTTTHDVIGYNIFVKCDTRPIYCCGPCDVTETTEDTELTFSVEGATTYYAMVASRTNQSASTWSTEVPLRTNPAVPNKPYIEGFPDKKSFTFNLTYGCPYTGPAEYVFGIEGGKQSTAKALGQDRCSYEFTVDELVPFTDYKYSLLAKNEGCWGTSSQGITDPHEEDLKTSYEIQRTTEAYTEDSSSIKGDVATESNITITTIDAPSITDDLATESNITVTTTDAPSITDDVETESNVSITSDEMSEPTAFHSTTRYAPFSSASTEEPPSEGGITTEFVKPHEICSSRFEGSVKTSPDGPYLDGTPYIKLSSSELESYPLYKSYPIQIRKEMFHEHNGPITKCQILLAEGNTQNRDQVDYFDMSGRTSTFQGRIVYSESTLPDRFIFGRDESQCELGETCNAFLDPSKTYQFLFRVFSGSKYTESMTYSFTTKVACRSNEFKCHSGECIHVIRLCDYKVDCPNGEDEAQCQLPKEPKMTSNPAGEKDTYTVTWDTESYTPIVQYRLRYRKSTANLTTPDHGGWHNRLYSPKPTEDNASGHLHHMNHAIDGLELATAYEAAVSVENNIGWSDLSEIFYFYTWKVPCLSHEFKCRHSGECTDDFRQCDFFVDCPNGEDEALCRFG